MAGVSKLYLWPPDHCPFFRKKRHFHTKILFNYRKIINFKTFYKMKNFLVFQEPQEHVSDMGELLVSLLYNENLKRLTATVIEARRLKVSKLIEKFNFFVILEYKYFISIYGKNFEVKYVNAFFKKYLTFVHSLIDLKIVSHIRQS